MGAGVRRRGCIHYNDEKDTHKAELEVPARHDVVVDGSASPSRAPT